MDSKEYRKSSIMDKITWLQAEAWTVEHEVAHLPSTSHIKQSYLAEARSLRTQDTKNKIQALFTKLDAQNDFLDGIAQARDKGHDISLFEPHVDYSLIEQ